MRVRLAFHVAVVGVVFFAGTALAGPVTYDLVAPPSGIGGKLTGQITWDSAIISSNADLTLANASTFTFAYQTPPLSMVPGYSVTAGDPGISIGIDLPAFSGVFGLTDLHPLGPNLYVVLGNPPSVLAPVTLLLPDSNWISDYAYLPDSGAAWYLSLKSPLKGPGAPEPRAPILLSLGFAGVFLRRRGSVLFGRS